MPGFGFTPDNGDEDESKVITPLALKTLEKSLSNSPEWV